MTSQRLTFQNIIRTVESIIIFQLLNKNISKMFVTISNTASIVCDDDDDVSINLKKNLCELCSQKTCLLNLYLRSIMAHAHVTILSV
jgi:hypothetical protein